MEKIDVVVIGAGVIGLAIARALALKGREVIVAESEKIAGSVTSARNSGVIHAGIYYTPGTAKAAYCLRGKELLYAYARDRRLPYKNCGKLIVATSDPEIEKLEKIRLNAQKNNVHDLRMITRKEALEMEPELSCLAAIHSPSTGIIDVHSYILSLLTDFEDAGGTLALQNKVTSGEIVNDGIILEFNQSPDMRIKANVVVNASGLSAQTVARTIRGIPAETIPPQQLAKGNYFSLPGKSPFTRLVYPIPVPGGLGAHYTMNMAGESLFGPDVEWLDSASGQNINYTVDPARAGQFYESIRRYWPGVDKHELQPAYSGIRSKSLMPDMNDSDFIIQGPEDHGVRGLINLYAIESPGLTSSLAIAQDIAGLL